jgi:hypothetical protein
VVPGVYKVTVTKIDNKTATVVAPTTNPADAIKQGYGQFVKDSTGRGATKAASKSKEIPDIYNDPDKTPFKFTVPIPNGKAELAIQKGK